MVDLDRLRIPRPPASKTAASRRDYVPKKRPPSAKSRSTSSSRSSGTTLPAAAKTTGRKKKLRLDQTSTKRGYCVLPPKPRVLKRTTPLPSPYTNVPRGYSQKDYESANSTSSLRPLSTEQGWVLNAEPEGGRPATAKPEWARPDIRALRTKRHEVLKKRLFGPFPEGSEQAIFGAGCFWGTEKGFWKLPGVTVTAVGYAGGKCCDPRYEQVCSGRTGHVECTLVVWDPTVISFGDLLQQFWRCHDPTQGNRQGNDKGSQYRSAIYCNTALQSEQANTSLKLFEKALRAKGFGSITTEIVGPEAEITFWYAEPNHQQHLAQTGSRQYCSAEPTGVKIPAIEGTMLPKAFWHVYDSSVRSLNAQVKWKPQAKDTLKLKEQAKKQALEAAALKAAAEAKHEITIQYCGGCGFANRAVELAEMLRTRVGVEAALIRDQGVTGRFDVCVKQQGGKFKRVHSKQDGQGFVDTESKTVAIVAALNAAAA